MSNNLVHQTPKDQFLHWRQEMKRKQEEQAKQMHELQARTECLQHENDQLRSQVEKSLKLGKDVQDGDCAEHLVVRNKGKELMVSDNKAPVDNELSSGRSHPQVPHQEGMPEVA